MRRPPPITDFIKYPIVGGTIALAVGVSVAWWSGKIDIGSLTATIDIRRGQLWRILTSTLPHVNAIHLIFNVYWVWVFGTLFEEVYGHLKTLGIFVFLAIAANGAEYAVLSGGVGLSGIVYGLFGMLWALSRRDRRFNDAIDQPTINVFVGWFFVCIALTISNVLPIGNVAHGVGAVAGTLLGWAISMFGIVQARTSRDGAEQLGWRATGSWPQRLLALTALVLLIAGVLVGDTIARPWFNLSKDRGSDEAQLAYTALIDNRNEEALRWLRDATRMQPHKAGYWFNLGIACDRLNRHAEAIAAFKRARDIEPSNAEYQTASRHGDDSKP